MTDRRSAAAGSPAARQASRRQRALPVYLAMATIFVGMFGSLAVRVAQGRDPALGAPTIARVAAPRQVIVRRVFVTRRITVLEPAAPPAPGGATVASAPAAGGSGTPMQQPPPTSAPAPVSAQPPAPAPAATRTS